MIQKCLLGKSGLGVSALVPGCMEMSFLYGPVFDKKEKIFQLHAAVELTSEDLHEIHAASSKIELQGARYPESAAKLVGR